MGELTYDGFKIHHGHRHFNVSRLRIYVAYAHKHDTSTTWRNRHVNTINYRKIAQMGYKISTINIKAHYEDLITIIYEIIMLLG